MIVSLSESTTAAVNILHLTRSLTFFSDLWSWIFNFFTHTYLAFTINGQSYHFTLFMFLVALFISGIIFSVFLTAVKSSAISTGSSLRSVDRAIHKAVVKGDKSSKNGNKG